MGTGWFVGRASELGRLGGLVAGLADGVGGVALVAGEQGIGKTALLRRCLAGMSGCRVCWGAADELGQRFPLLLMVDCLGEEARLAVHGRPMAEEGARLGPVPSGDPILAAVERLLALVDRWCAASPVVVVAEDLQWADEASLLAWRRLALAARQMPLLVVGSFRPVPAAGGVGPLRQSVADSSGVVVDLEPLPPGEVAELAGGLLGARPGGRLSGLLGWAGGNPLYVRELVDALARDGRVALTGGVAELAGDPRAVRVPTSLEAAISGRLGGLASAVGEVLRWAAVLGPEFSVTDLAAVTRRSAGELWPVIDQAAAAGVVAAQAGPRLAFRHGLIRQVLYEGVPQSVREALHLEAARALAGAGVPPERVAAQLVVAPGSAGGLEWVWEWLAGCAGVLVFQAPVVAAELLRRALERMPEGDGRREGLEAELVRVAFLLVLDEEVEGIARPLLARTADLERAAEVSWLLGYTLNRAGRHDEAVALAAAALARPGLGEVWAARLRARQAMALLITGQVDQAAELAERALAEAERAGDRFAAGYALHALSAVAYLQRDRAGSLGNLERALAVIGDDPRTTDLRLLLLSNRARALADLDRHTEASLVLREALALAERAGTPRLGTICAAAADHSYEAGQWDDALAMLNAAAGLPGPHDDPIALHGLAALIAARRDDWDVAEGHLAAVSDQSISVPGHRAHASWLLQAQALAAEREGGAGQAVAVLAQCLDPRFAAGMPFRDRLLPVLTRLALAAGDGVSAAAARAADEEADQEPTPLATAAADHCRGLVDDDPEPVLAAARYYESAGRPADQAMAMADAAELLARRGDLPAARRVFTEAAGLYQGLGARWDLRRAAARLRPFGIRARPAGPTRPHRGWAALTPTEAKIARLVAEGRSNPDIAAELSLSRNTVQTHVSHILAKLGARSRAEVIRQVLERAGRPAVG